MTTVAARAFQSWQPSMTRVQPQSNLPGIRHTQSQPEMDKVISTRRGFDLLLPSDFDLYLPSDDILSKPRISYMA